MAKPKTSSVEPTNEETLNSAPMDLGGIPDDADLVEENVGFDPYWEPADGARCYASVVGFDVTDPQFIRINLIAEAPVRCFKGPKDEQEEITVQVGERFNMSLYAALRRNFQEYLGYAAEGALIPIVIAPDGFSKEKSRETGKPWRLWKISVTKETRATLLKLRASRAKNIMLPEKVIKGELVEKNTARA